MRTKSQNELSIAVYARGIRNIQKTQLEPYEKLIQEELGRLFPSLLKNDENGVVDWSYDIMNCSSDNEVFETLERIRQIQQEQQKNDWICKYCGKNTYDVDCEYLFGTDHVSCAVENESVTSNNIDGLMSKMSRMQDYITQLESRLSQLETQYEEPTN
jgi:hypothetical protein